MLLAHQIRLNLDGVSQVERVGRRAPGRTIGLRINPGTGAGYTEHLSYAGERPTKFGVTEWFRPVLAGLHCAKAMQRCSSRWLQLQFHDRAGGAERRRVAREENLQRLPGQSAPQGVLSAE